MTAANWALARKRALLLQRAAILQKVRAFFNGQDYLEVETPHRIPANAPEQHIDAVPSGDWALHTSPELAMKRLLAAGHEKIFQICRVWRDGERGQYHLPEFSLLEWYRSGVDYHELMAECKRLLLHLVPEGKLVRAGREISLVGSWENLTVADAFSSYAAMNLERALETGCFEELLTAEVEPNLGKTRPTFLTEYPLALAALARAKPGDPRFAERFELYIDGLELANAFSELTDPLEQRKRFTAEERQRRAAGKRPYPLPENFLNELSAMPEAAGIALGLDRLVMLITGAERIDDVVAFTPGEL
jgi:lysyl-tRNA synthetase class 2